MLMKMLIRIRGVPGDRQRSCRVKLDRTFIEAGERWIVDYKVTDMEGGARQDFLKAQVEKYRPDLQIYKQVMAAFDPRPIRLALYFPLLRELREV